MSPTPPPARAPHRQLGVLDATAIYVGIVVGSGIFFAPSEVAAAAPGLAAAVGLWILGGVIAGCGALCYAECGARLPQDGGFFVFYRRVFGDGVAFVGGWVAYLITYPASMAVIALVLARYLGEVIPAVQGHTGATAAVALFGVTGLNLLGVRENAWTQRLLTGIKVTAIIALCAAALLAESAAPTAAPVMASAPLTFTTLLMAMVAVLWTYSGWSDVTLVTGELRDPARSLGRTVLGGTAALIGLFVLVQVAVMTALPDAASSPRVVADAVEAVLGASSGRAVAVLVVVSTFGALNGTMLVVSRLGFAMAEDGTAPAWLGKRKWGTPVASVLTVFGVTLIYVTSSGFRDLLGMFTFSVWLFYGLTVVALFVLRRRGVGEPVAWRAPGGLLPPLLVLVTGLLMTASLLADPEQRRLALFGLVWLASGVPAYLIWRRFARRA